MESDKPDLNSILENARAQLEMYGRPSQEDLNEAAKEILLTRPKDQEMEDASGPLFDKAKESAGMECARAESVKSVSSQNQNPDEAKESKGAEANSEVEGESVEVEDEESSNKNFDSSTMTLGDQQSFQNQVELTSQTTYTNIHELTGPVKDDILIVTGATVEPSDTISAPSQVSDSGPEDVSSELTQVTLENVIAPAELTIDDELHKPDELQHNQMTGSTNYLRGWKSDPCRDTLQDSVDMDDLPTLDQIDGCLENGDSALKAGAGTREGSPVRQSPKLMLQVAERLSQLELHEGKQCPWLKQGICEKGKDCVCERNDINDQISKDSSMSESYLEVKGSSDSKSEGNNTIKDEPIVQNYIINTNLNSIDNRQVEFVEYFDANEVDKSNSAIRKSSDKSIFEDEGFVDSKELMESTKVIFISDQEDEQSCKPFETEDDVSCLLEPSSAGRSLDLQSDLEAKPSLTDVHQVQKHLDILDDVITDSERAVSVVQLESDKDLSDHDSVKMSISNTKIQEGDDLLDHKSENMPITNTESQEIDDSSDHKSVKMSISNTENQEIDDSSDHKSVKMSISNTENQEIDTCVKPKESDSSRASSELLTSAQNDSYESDVHNTCSTNDGIEAPPPSLDETYEEIDNNNTLNMDNKETAVHATTAEKENLGKDSQETNNDRTQIETQEPIANSKATENESPNVETQCRVEKDSTCVKAQSTKDNSEAINKQTQNLNLDNRETKKYSTTPEKHRSNAETLKKTEHLKSTESNNSNKQSKKEKSKAVKKHSKSPSTSQTPFEAASLLPQIFEVLSKNREKNKEEPKAKPMCIGRTIFEAFIKNMSKNNSDSPELHRLKAILDKANQQDNKNPKKKIASLHNSSCSTDFSSATESSTPTQIDVRSLNSPNSSVVPKGNATSSEDDSENEQPCNTIDIIERLSRDPLTIPLIPTTFLNQPQQPVSDLGISSDRLPLLLNPEALNDLNIRPSVPLSPAANKSEIEDPLKPHISETDFEPINNFDNYNSSKELTNLESADAATADNERPNDDKLNSLSGEPQQDNSGHGCLPSNPSPEALNTVPKKIDSDTKTPIIEEVFSNGSSSIISSSINAESSETPVSLEISNLVWSSVREAPQVKVSPETNETVTNDIITDKCDNLPTVIIQTKTPIAQTMEGNVTFSIDNNTTTQQTANDQNLLTPFVSEIQNPTQTPGRNINDFISDISVPHIRPPPPPKHPALQIHSTQSTNINLDSEDEAVEVTKTPPRPPPRPRATVQTKKKKLNFFKKLFGIKAKN